MRPIPSEFGRRLGGFRWTLFLTALASAIDVRAQLFVFEVNQAVPDGVGAGLVDTRTVSGVGPGAVPTVGLTFSGLGAGMVNGDLYVTLGHENAVGGVDAFAVLLNRPGKRFDDDEGYRDSGMSITLTPDASTPDVHTYRRTLSGSDTVPLGGPLTGVWSLDGRSVDPDLVLDIDPRATSLDAFGLVDGSTGRWLLFVSDLVSGGEARLDSWSLSFAPIPEPEVWGTFAAFGLVLCAAWRRRKGKRMLG